MKRVLILIIGGLAIFANMAQAGSYLIRAGFVPSNYQFDLGKITMGTEVKDSQGVAIKAGQGKVQAFALGIDTVINDPNSTAFDDYELPYTKPNATKLVGDDTDTWQGFPSSDGHFYHEWGEASTSINAGTYLYIRVWDSPNPIQDSKFGESIDTSIRAAYGEPAPASPSTFGLTTFKTILPQTAPVDAPTSPSLTAIAASGPGAAPSLVISFNRVVGARWYVLDVSDPAAAEIGPFTYSAHAHKDSKPENSYHIADIDATAAHGAVSIILDPNDDTQYFKVRITPWNDYGAGVAVETDAKQVPETPNPYKAVAVTDLKAEFISASSSIQLSWTAPYAIDKHNALTNCKVYDIRVSREAIVDLPMQPFSAATTNPNNITSWDKAIAVTDQNVTTKLGINQITAGLPEPAIFESNGTYNADTISLTGAFSGTYYFALKANDLASKPADRWSYVSNIASVSFGGGGIMGTLEVLDLVKTPDLGINQFELTVDPTTTIYYNDNLSDKASLPLIEQGTGTIAALVNAINRYAGTDAVQTIGWWNKSVNNSQRMEGYVITYPGTNFGGSPGTLGAGAELLENTKVYQVSVLNPVSGFRLSKVDETALPPPPSP